MSLYVVTAYRWGLRDAHSYVVGAYREESDANRVARDHVDYRGGKYGCEVMKAGESLHEEGNAAVQVAYYESPYFTIGGQNRPACQPADYKKKDLTI